MRQNDDRVALEMLKSLTAKAPLTSLYECAGLYMKKGHEEESLQSIETALLKAPKSSLLNCRKVEILYTFENYRALFAHCSVILHLDGRFIPLSLLKAEALLQCGQTADAFSYLYNMEKSFPESIPVLESLGLINLHHHHLDKARDYFERITALSPYHVSACLCRGIISYRQADYQHASEEFRKCLKMTPWEKDIYCWLGAAEYGAGRCDRALFFFTMAAVSGTGYFRGWNNRAVCLCREGDYEQALSHAEKALRLERENPHGWFVRSACERAKERWTMPIMR